MKAAQRGFAPLSAVNLLARLHPAERQFPLAMRSLLNVAMQGARRSSSPWRVSHIEMPLDGLGRLEVSTRGGWLWVPEAGRDEPLCHGGNLLSLLAALSGASAGLYAAETLEAFTGFRVSGLSRAALRDFLGRFDGSHSRLLAGSRPETLWAISASLKGASLHPLMLSLLTGLFPRGAASESAFFYENARAGVRFTVLRGGRWVARFQQQEAQIRAHGRDALSLLTLLSGIEAGFWAERILTTALGLDLPGDERGRLAQGVGEAMPTAVLSFEGDA
ncbi:hypothetical protein [Pannonibacter tanglangensis]|uniref:Uncharacterized protein n=1 Tax=Pannonibacter tanglangensis TaxID=2750084 RepID=A0ABW9ZLY8_9HYPH|nr:hypothetical protein [Pannonibacter sp. XCT-34]NBN65937.1 hypothetical protein [Pannonibacter sp. XCT-34]